MFIAATFTAYFTLSKSNTKEPSIEVYCVICLGFVLSVAWFFINRGSKFWQRHWEAHIELLEDSVTGPLYKTIYDVKSFSVSEINEIVSGAFVFVWVTLGFNYLLHHHLINWQNNMDTVEWQMWVISLVAIGAVCAMSVGHGRGRFSKRKVTM